MCDKKRKFEPDTKENEPRLRVQMVQRPQFSNWRRAKNLGFTCLPTLADYVLHEIIGEGSFGYVYKGESKATKKIVALKQLKDSKVEGKIIDEIEMCVKSKHPNVIEFVETVRGTLYDGRFIVMEYCKEDLLVVIRAKRRTGGSFASHVKLGLMRQLLSAVDHMHQMHIAHRDLKPSNLLMTVDFVLKIGDFGSAMEIRPESNGMYSPRVGTQAYRSPEQLIGSTRYSVAIDMWAVGCIFAELYTLWPIFAAVTNLEQFNKLFECVGYPTNQTWPQYFQQSAVNIPELEMDSSRTMEALLGSQTSADELDLLNKLLKLDSSQRISAKSALEHSVIK